MSHVNEKNLLIFLLKNTKLMRILHSPLGRSYLKYHFSNIFNGFSCMGKMIDGSIYAGLYGSI